MTMSEVGGDKPPAPPLPPPMKKKRSGRKGKGVVVVEGGGGGGGGGGRAKIGNHILNERERRKKMNDKFSTLHHLLPHIPTKSNRSSIIGEATRYIKKLQVILQDGERQKLERVQNGVVENLTSKVEISTGESSNNNNNNNNKDLTLIVSSDFGPVFETWSWPNVVLNMCGEYGQFSVCTLKKPNILSSISFLFEQFKLDVVNCNIISNQTSYMYMFLTQVMRNGSSTDHLELPTAEVLEIFKRAAAEISYWLSS